MAPAAAAVVLVLGGCGEDEPEGRSTADYLREVRAVCVDNAAELKDIVDLNIDVAGRKIDGLEAQGFADQVGSGIDVLVLQLRQLEKPEDEVPAVERLIQVYERLGTDATASSGNEDTAIRFLASIKRRVAEIDKAARAADAPACGA